MSKFEIKNKYLIGLGSWLNELNLSGKESRERTRFVNLIVKHIDENEKFRMEIISKYCEKDENGENRKKMNEQGQEVWDMSEENQEKFAKEFIDLMDENFIIDVLEGNKEKTKVVKDIVLNTNYVFGPKEGDSPEEKSAKVRQANDYNIWCESFEAVTIE